MGSELRDVMGVAVGRAKSYANGQLSRAAGAAAGYLGADVSRRVGQMSNVAGQLLGGAGSAQVARAAGALGQFFGVGGFEPQLVGQVLLQLGEYQFSVGTAAHQSIARTREWRWAQVERIQRAPAQQFVGPGADSITLAGVVYPEFAGGTGQIEAMAAEAAMGEPLLLVDHYGNVLGDYCIKSITETGTALDPRGRARKVEFSLSLVAYGEDDRDGAPGGPV